MPRKSSLKEIEYDPAFRKKVSKTKKLNISVKNPFYYEVKIEDLTYKSKNPFIRAKTWIRNL